MKTFTWGKPHKDISALPAQEIEVALGATSKAKIKKKMPIISGKECPEHLANLEQRFFKATKSMAHQDRLELLGECLRSTAEAALTTITGKTGGTGAANCKAIWKPAYLKYKWPQRSDGQIKARLLGKEAMAG